MTHVLDHDCVVCGSACRGRRCLRCVRAGFDALSLWCRCDDPKPEPVWIFGTVRMPDAWQCRRCGRPIEGGV